VLKTISNSIDYLYFDKTLRQMQRYINKKLIIEKKKKKIRDGSLSVTISKYHSINGHYGLGPPITNVHKLPPSTPFHVTDSEVCDVGVMGEEKRWIS